MIGGSEQRVNVDSGFADSELDPKFECLLQFCYLYHTLTKVARNTILTNSENFS